MQFSGEPQVLLKNLLEYLYSFFKKRVHKRDKYDMILF